MFDIKRNSLKTIFVKMRVHCLGLPSPRVSNDPIIKALRIIESEMLKKEITRKKKYIYIFSNTKFCRIFLLLLKFYFLEIVQNKI